jgi:hypothetical protein
MAKDCAVMVEEKVLTEIKSGALEITEDNKLNHQKVIQAGQKQNIRKNVAAIKTNMQHHRDKFTIREWEAK